MVKKQAACYLIFDLGLEAFGLQQVAPKLSEKGSCEAIVVDHAVLPSICPPAAKFVGYDA